MRLRLIKALNNRFYVKFMQLEIGLLIKYSEFKLIMHSRISVNKICKTGGRVIKIWGSGPQNPVFVVEDSATTRKE